MQSGIQSVERMFKAIESGDVSDADKYIARITSTGSRRTTGGVTSAALKNFERLRRGFVARSRIYGSTMPIFSSATAGWWCLPI
jgi:hypothetical protein